MEPDQERLVLEHLEVAKKTAAGIKRVMPPQVDEDDLYQMAILGLMDAARLFDPSRGVRFKTYATHRIRGYIFDQLRESDWVPRLTRYRQRIIQSATERFITEKGRRPTLPELQDFLGLPEHAFSILLGDSSPPQILSVEGGHEDDPGDKAGGILMHLDDGTDFEFDLHEKDLVKQALTKLNPKQRFVMENYYFNGLSMREIAFHMDLTESRVCQIHTKASERLHLLIGLLEKGKLRPVSPRREPEMRTQLKNIDLKDIRKQYEKLSDADKHLVRECWIYLKTGGRRPPGDPPPPDPDQIRAGNEHMVRELNKYIEEHCIPRVLSKRPRR